MMVKGASFEFAISCHHTLMLKNHIIYQHCINGEKRSKWGYFIVNLHIEEAITQIGYDGHEMQHNLSFKTRHKSYFKPYY